MRKPIRGSQSGPVRDQVSRKRAEAFLPTIPAHEIESIRRLIATDLRYDPCPLLSEGTMVEVEHGPLKGVVGRLARTGRHARLILAVNLIGQGVSVEVDAADIKVY